MSNTKQDITKLALAETVEFIKQMNIARTVETQVKRYLKLHEKGIKFNFSFGSSGLKSSFDHFLIRHKIDRSLTEAIKTDVKLPNGTRYRYMNKEATLNKDKMVAERKLKDFKHAIHNAQSLHSSLPEEYLKSKQYESVQGAIKDLTTLEETQYKNEIQNKKDLIDMVKRISHSQRSLSSNIENLERMFEKMVARFYTSRVKYYLEEMFPNQTVLILYKDYNWFDNNRMNQVDYRDDYVDGFSIYEDRVYSWLCHNELNFRVEFLKDNYKAYLYSGSAGITTNRNHKPEEKGYTTIQKANENISNFFLKNPTFYIMLKTSQLLTTHVDESSLTHQHLLYHLLNEQKDKVEEYNKLVEQKNNAVDEDPSMQEKPPALKDFFPEATLTYEEVENLLYHHIGSGDKTKTVLQKLETDKFVFSTYRGKAKSLI